MNKKLISFVVITGLFTSISVFADQRAPLTGERNDKALDEMTKRSLSVGGDVEIAGHENDYGGLALKFKADQIEQNGKIIIRRQLDYGAGVGKQDQLAFKVDVRDSVTWTALIKDSRCTPTLSFDGDLLDVSAVIPKSNRSDISVKGGVLDMGFGVGLACIKGERALIIEPKGGIGIDFEGLPIHVGGKVSVIRQDSDLGYAILASLEYQHKRDSMKGTSNKKDIVTLDWRTYTGQHVFAGYTMSVSNRDVSEKILAEHPDMKNEQGLEMSTSFVAGASW